MGRGIGAYSGSAPLSIRLAEGQKEQLKSIPNWDNALRSFIKEFIEANEQQQQARKMPVKSL